MADTEWVEIEHPDVDGTARVAARSLDHWRGRGWTVAPPAPPKAKPAPKTTTRPAPTTTTPATPAATEEKAEG